MTETRTIPLAFPLAGAALVAGLATTNWALDPEDAMTWAISGLFLPVAWGAFEVLLRGRKGLNEIRGSAVLAASLLTLTLGFSAAEAAGLLGSAGGDVVRRAYGVGVGLVLVIIGNFMPKRLEPMLEKRHSPAAIQSLQRFSGWTFVVAGIGYAGAWLTLPIGPANIVSTIICAGAVVLVIGRWVLMSTNQRMS